MFHETRDRKVGPALKAARVGSDPREFIYRPLDRRRLLTWREFVDFPRPDLQAASGSANVALYALPSGTGAGPDVWVHGVLPDYHAFRGSYGGYAFPLWDRRHGSNAHNLHQPFLDGLATVYGRAITPEDVFNGIAALLSAASYTSRFAWDLEETFAHIPFPAEVGIFGEAARIGAEIVGLETFAREPEQRFHSARLLGRASSVILTVPPINRAFLADGSGAGYVSLQQDQSLRIAHLPERVWNFAVSGYRVLPRWLIARNGEALDSALQRAILDVAWRIEELLYWFDAADGVLARSIDRPLTRTALGL
jgi:predicted helicase